MREERSMTEEFIEQYVTTPQNDLQQIHQVSREYESEPARGVAHGLQKDAIQNGVGARIPHSSEPTSYKDWAFTFRLFKIGDTYALSFWDSGTTGLTGEILAKDDISKWSAEGRLTADQKLSRFLTRFDSGGNVGPGSFGRGKLIFQAASKSYAIVCDSLRYDDKKYVAFERKLEHNQLIQTAIPHQADAAKGFIQRICRGTLRPLEGPGTRITVLDLKEEVVEAFKNSFRDDRPEIANDYSSSFMKMIEETWWEIISKFRVKISLEFEGRTKQVQINEPLKSLANARDRENGWRVYRRSNMEVIVQNKTYKIKELVIALSPNPLNEDLRGIWIQRKRMKVGLVKNIFPHPTVSKKILGYVILDRDLEDEVEKSEGTTHYSFNFRHSAPSQIRQFVETNLQKFQEELGIRTFGDSKMAKQNMLEAMKEINEMSRKLGLISPYDVGTEFKVEISIESFALPHAGSKRIDFGDSIGPILYKVTNHTRNPEKLELVVNAVQKDTQKP